MDENPRILLVDDDTEIVGALMLRLSASGYEVVRAENGEQGLALAHSVEPAVIVVDIRMPVMDGLTMIRRLRDQEATRVVPIIVLSASVAQKQRAFDLGARFFLEKPYDAKTLIEAIRSALKGTWRRAPT